MNVLDSIILGIVQGVTEFLPISSSGHLIIARDIFGWHGISDLSFDAILQLATILVVIIYFRKDILVLIKAFCDLILRKQVEVKDKILIYAIIIGTIPATIAGLFLENYMETIFRSALLVSIVLIFGSVVMYCAEKVNARFRRTSLSSDQGVREDKALTIKDGLIVGLFQCLALVPGFSRSGATISGGLFCGLNREDAAKFSFLLSVPIILGSGGKKFFDLIKDGAVSTDLLNLFAGFVAAFVVGYFVINFLMKYLKRNSLNIFIWYRIILAIVVLVVLL